MKENKMVEAIGGVDEKYVSESIQYTRKRRGAWGRVANIVTAVAACFVLVLGATMFMRGNANVSIVSIDVNPSIELTVNKAERVISATALNEDAVKVLDGMELKDVELDTALNAIVGSMLKNGYLDEVYNAVNICVENDDVERAEELSNKVAGEISNILVANDLIGGVSTQSCVSDTDMQKLADSYGISVGKLGLAQGVATNTGMTLDNAVGLSVSELWDLVDASGITLISKEEAFRIVLEDSGVAESDITEMSIKIKATKDLYKYDIKIKIGDQKEYKYVINAETGVILEYEFKIHPEKPVNAPIPADQISKMEALEIAYLDAGIDVTEVVLEELLHRPAEKQYYIEFSVGLTEYVYVIDAVNGDIVSKEVIEKAEDITEEEKPTAKITFDKALEIALNMAGVKFEDLTMCDIKYHVKKDKKPEYKVHFHVDKEHYEFIVDALTGECVEKKRPEPPKKDEPKKPEPPKKDDPKKPEPPKKDDPKKPEPPKKDDPKKPEPPKPEDPVKPEPPEEPTEEPSEEPTEEPSGDPGEEPSEAPSEEDSEEPEVNPEELKSGPGPKKAPEKIR